MRCILILLLGSQLLAQTPPRFAEEPRPLPPQVTNQPAPIKLPRDENLITIDLRNLRVQHLAQKLVITNGHEVFRECNPKTSDAEDTVKLIRELQAVRWGVLGKSRVVVEYGLTLGSGGELTVPHNAGFPKTTLPIDVKSVRTEAIRGAWCVRDNATILLNFGAEKEEAEQAVAVIHKYGFNRLGTAVKNASRDMAASPSAVTYFYAASSLTPAAASTPYDIARQNEKVLARAGIDVPGLGFIGELLTIEPKKLEVRREPAGVTLRYGNDVLGNFGSDEWTARDAQKMIHDARYTEVARFGSAMFFLKNGKVPDRVPFQVRTTPFDPARLRAIEINGKWWMADATGKPLLPAASEKEAGDLVKLVKAYQFNLVATLGNSPKSSLQFLAKGN